MADARPRRRSIFSGVLLILLGTLFLLHNFRPGFHVWELFSRWWPVLLIFLGLAKLYDHLVARRSGEAAPRTITGGEILLLVLAMMLAAGVGGFDWMHGHGDVDIPWPPWEHPYSFSEEIPAKQIPADARITVRTDHGDDLAAQVQRARIPPDDLVLPSLRLVQAGRDRERSQQSLGPIEHRLHSEFRTSRRGPPEPSQKRSGVEGRVERLEPAGKLSVSDGGNDEQVARARGRHVRDAHHFLAVPLQERGRIGEKLGRGAARERHGPDLARRIDQP